MLPSGWQHEPAVRKSRGNPVKLVGIGAGGVAILILFVLLVATFTRNRPVTEERGAAKPVDERPSSTVATSQTEEIEAPVPPLGTTSNDTSVPESPVAPDEPQVTSEPTPPANTASPTWRDIGTTVNVRLEKPDSWPGVKLIGSDPVIVAGYSWMTALLPYLGEEQRHQKFNFNKSWSDKVNLQLTGPIDAFLNPADSRRTWVGWPYDGIGLTHFVGISGIEETRNDIAALLPRSDPRAGMFGYEEIARPAQIADGASQTLMLMGSGTLAAPWVQGGGATIRGLREPYFDELTGFGSPGLSERGALATFADGSVKTISAKISPQVLRNLATIRGAETIDRAYLADTVK